MHKNVNILKLHRYFKSKYGIITHGEFADNLDTVRTPLSSNTSVEFHFRQTKAEHKFSFDVEGSMTDISTMNNENIP